MIESVRKKLQFVYISNASDFTKSSNKYFIFMTCETDGIKGGNEPYKDVI